MSRWKRAGVVVLFAAVAGPAWLFSIAAERAPSRYSTLVIDYVGEQDRSIDKVVISTSREEGEWYKQNLYDESSLDLVAVFVIPKSTLAEITELPQLNRELQSATRYEEVPRRPVNVRFVVGIGHDHREVLLDAPASTMILREIAKRISSHSELKDQIREVLYATEPRKLLRCLKDSADGLSMSSGTKTVPRTPIDSPMVVNACSAGFHKLKRYSTKS